MIKHDETLLRDGDESLSSVDTGEEMVSEEISTGEERRLKESRTTNSSRLRATRLWPLSPRVISGAESVGEVLTLADETTQLRDLGEASFGLPEALAETVRGQDDRVRITNTSTYPRRVHASLCLMAADNSLWIGAGWFVGPRLLVTAGHVVYIKNSGAGSRRLGATRGGDARKKQGQSFFWVNDQLQPSDS